MEEALPADCLPGIDDRVETPEGSREHPVRKGIPWGECPGFEGFDRIPAAGRPPAGREGLKR